MAGLLDETKKTLTKRAAELRPLVEEYEEIQAVLERLGGSANGAAPARAPKAATARKPRARPRQNGGRRAEALQLITDKPGITVPELAAKMGIKGNYLYRVTAELAKGKQIRKDGNGFHAT